MQPMYSLADDLDTVCASPQTVRNEPSLPFTDPHHKFQAVRPEIACLMRAEDQRQRPGRQDRNAQGRPPPNHHLPVA